MLLIITHAYTCRHGPTQGRRMVHQSGGAQTSKTRTKSHLGGSGGMLPQENSTLRVFLRPSDSSFEASLYYVRHTEKYTHLKNEGLSPPFFQSGGARAPSALPISLSMLPGNAWVVDISHISDLHYCRKSSYMLLYK